MSLRNDHELDDTGRAWVTIVHPETGGTHTCPRDGWEDAYADKGWVLALDATDEQAEPEDSSSTTSDQGDTAPDGKDQ